MIFFLGEKLRYAETHFKFKLPWSLLYRPWPEIIVDAPFQFVPSVEPKLWIVVRDAHRFPTKLKSIEVIIRKKNPGNITDNVVYKTLTKELAVNLKKQFDFIPISLGRLEPGLYEIDTKFKVQRYGKNETDLLGKEKTFQRWNYPGLKPKPLIVKVLKETPPKAPGFAAGEMHCHTLYSCDHVEHGASPAVMQKAAISVGLDFVNFTDHAYDFAYLEEDYTKEAPSPAPRFQALQEEIKNLLAEAEKPLMLAGEEVSAGNSKGENVHMTLLAPESYIPGLGDCGRNWLENRPTLKIEKILEQTNAHCFAAHPFQQMGLLERFIFRRGYWKDIDIHTEKKHSIRGIQFWNGLRDEGFLRGREFWINELGKGNFLLPIGGNDAHGDLNDSTSVHLPLFSLRHNRHHVFGKVRTVVKLAECATKTETALSLHDLNKAFMGDNCYITDGPALWWERASLGTDTCITFHARSNSDFGGGFRYIRIFGRRILANGRISPKEEICMESQVAARESTDIMVPSSGYIYLRGECETASGKFAMTSAAPLQK